MDALKQQLSEQEIEAVVGGKVDEYGETIIDGGPVHKKDSNRAPGQYYQDGDWMCYKIKKNDTLNGIAQQFGVTVPRLQYINRNTITKTSQIYEGDIIRIRSANS